MNGETNQYYRCFIRNTSPVAAPRTPEQGYQLTENLADEAIAWLNGVKATNPKKPWPPLFSTRAVHAPHHAPQSYRDKYKGRFDAGWDKYREETFTRQKKARRHPADAKLTPAAQGNPGVGWAIGGRQEGLCPPDGELHRVSRVTPTRRSAAWFDAVAERGDLDNTLILYIVGDNGASAEGGPGGDRQRGLRASTESSSGLDGLLSKLDQIGGPETEPHVPVAWAWAANTPFQ